MPCGLVVMALHTKSSRVSTEMDTCLQVYNLGNVQLRYCHSFREIYVKDNCVTNSITPESVQCIGLLCENYISQVLGDIFRLHLKASVLLKRAGTPGRCRDTLTD